MVHMSGTIAIAFEIGNHVEIAKSNVVERLVTNVLMGCDYYDRHVEEIKLRQWIVQLDDGTTVPIIRSPGERKRNAVILREAEQFSKGTKQTSTKIRVSLPATPQPETPTFVTVTMNQYGLIVVETNNKLFKTNIFLVGTAVAQGEPHTELRILVANFTKQPKTLTIGQTISTTTEHPSALVESLVTHGEVLCVVVWNIYTQTNMRCKGGGSDQHFPRTQPRVGLRRKKRKTEYSGKDSIGGQKSTIKLLEKC